jgi:hypothetical protein
MSYSDRDYENDLGELERRAGKKFSAYWPKAGLSQDTTSTRETIVILPQAQIQPFNKTGGYLTGINILAEDEFPENLSQLARFPDLNDLSISNLIIRN